MNTMQVEFERTRDKDLTLTLRGNAESIVRILVKGLPREAVQQLHAAFQAELEKDAALLQEHGA